MQKKITCVSTDIICGNYFSFSSSQIMASSWIRYNVKTGIVVKFPS